jgi:hypothetical protein
MTESDAATADLSLQLFKAAEAGDLQAGTCQQEGLPVLQGFFHIEQRQSC